jgi:hypothetical protein
MGNKVVAHFLDGQLLKGTTANFSPAKDRFHIACDGGKAIEVRVNQLKALFFVRELAGNPAHHGRKEVDGTKGFGRKVRCEFKDGEILRGFAQTFDPSRPGFFLVPVDPAENNERVFVVTSGVKKVTTEG